MAPLPPPKDLPLRWESTGDQWWYASPIDCAAANGHYHLVRELLRIDPNLLIKLTSLPRIRRLESVWDDDDNNDNNDNANHGAKNRCHVASNLLRDCESKKGHNSLIRAGYGGWLLYTAASAGDVVFVKELLDRDPNLVFGEGEYGVTDIFYAAARSRSCEAFRMLLDHALAPKGTDQVLRTEMVNRAVHAAARGGNLEMLVELLMDGDDVLDYRDAHGSTVLHSAAATGQVEVVKRLISSYDIISSLDNQGNTALNVAAYRGNLAVLELLILASPSTASLRNNYGETFLHMAIAGFGTPSFRRLDRQIELFKRLVSRKHMKIEDIINVQNNEGRTALHMAVIDNVQSDIVELLMSVCYIDLNLCDNDGNTPLDLLLQRPRPASSMILIKRLISTGGISNNEDRKVEDVVASNLRVHGIVGSPGTSFRIPDAEIFLYTGMEDAYPSSCDLTGTEYNFSGEIEHLGSTDEPTPSRYKKSGSMNKASMRLKILLGWLGGKKRTASLSAEDNYSVGSSYRMCSGSKNSPIPLRQQFSRQSSLPNNKRIGLPTPFAKKKFAAGLTQGVLRVMPSSSLGSPSSAYSDRLGRLRYVVQGQRA